MVKAKSTSLIVYIYLYLTISFEQYYAFQELFSTNNDKISRLLSCSYVQRSDMVLIYDTRTSPSPLFRNSLVYVFPWERGNRKRVVQQDSGMGYGFEF